MNVISLFLVAFISAVKKIIIIIVSILVVICCAIAAFLIWYFGKIFFNYFWF